MASSAAFMSAMRAAGLVGIWNTDIAASKTVLEEGASEILLGNPSLDGKAIPLDMALSQIHSDDKIWVFEQIDHVRRVGGAFSSEFRVQTQAGAVRWIMCRGVVKPDRSGILRGTGAYFDTTDTHGSVLSPASGLIPNMHDPLAIAADRCLETHAALKLNGNEDLQRYAEILLLEIGRELAQRRH